MNSRPHVVHYIKAPDNTHRTYRLVKRVKQAGRVTQEQLDVESVRALNRALANASMEKADIDLQARKLVSELNAAERLKRMGSYVATDANLKLFKVYWDAVYARKDIQHEFARWRFLQALNYVGSAPLLGKVDVLQANIDSKCKDRPRTQSRMVSCVNRLRAWHGVHERLQPKKRVLPSFHYITAKDLPKLLASVEAGEHTEAVRALFTVLFYSGARTGEAFAFRRENLRKEVLTISRQVRRDGAEAPTKTRQARRTILLKEAHEAFSFWVGYERKAEIDRRELSRVIRRAGLVAFPRQSEKHVVVHDLRHSFAVMMLVDFETTVSAIAKMLGNKTEVCEDYYLNFIPEDEVLMSVLEKTRSRK